ncbi:Rho-type gtpase-activating protein [Onygenales sp. PD_12]|nr:Rho-type gtpase-activating protein [Onygenales sp. PD_12]KAK2795073.1 Rho-type gtpase-activating protein [Onygenales sp. PD_10]
MESPTGYPESPSDLDDIPYPCKGCGEILEEGKAFELAGKRWHIDCFRCNTCETLLDSDANLLLLGDGSLICNNCTYSCSSCGNKIEDLAILTGDQAFCANCFKCRNCKRKIENLRYARTSQGIFCMDCHESLMARRRKRTARNAAQRQKVANVHLDKSLPSLPPSMMGSDANTPSTDPYSDTPTELPSRGRSEDERSYSRNSRNDRNITSPDPQAIAQDNLILPSSTYKSNRHSAISHKSDGSAGEEFLIPVAFDPTPTEHHSPQPATSDNSNNGPRDYFGRTSLDTSQKQSLDRHGYLQDPGHSEASSEQPSPYQDKRRADQDSHRRQDSTANTSISNLTSSTNNNDKIRQQNAVQKSSASGADMHGHVDKFKLQDVPKGRRSGGSGSISRSEFAASSREDSPNDDIVISPPPRDISRTGNQIKSAQLESNGTSSLYSQQPHSNENGASGSSRSGSISAMQYPPKRGDSLESKLQHSIQRKDLASMTKPTPPTSTTTNDGTPSSSSVFSSPFGDKTPGGKGVAKAAESSSSKRASDTSTSAVSPHHRRATSGSISKQKTQDHRRNHSRNESLQSDSQREIDNGTSPMLRYSGGGDFSLDEDMARILGGEEIQNQESFLKRVSNSVRHGRSFSDKGARLSKEPKWPKSPSTNPNMAAEISSPNTSSPEGRDELAWYKNELRRERQKVIEKDQRISELESSLNATANIKQVNTELREKRSTMVFLDAQKEIVLRELEVLTEHIAKEKRSDAALDLGRMSNGVLREFAETIQRLKDSFAPQIEELMQKKNNIHEELSSLSRMKDKSFQEFEQLSLKNSQLAELNNQLVHQIQGLYKANTNSTGEGVRPPPNGLGIYHSKDKSVASLDGREIRVSNDLQPSNTHGNSEEAEPVTMVQGPQVVSIRKGQPRKFNWKKGGQNVAKGVTKGLKGAFNYGEGKYQRDGQFTETAPYGSISLQGGFDGSSRSQAQDPARQGFGFFGNQKSKPTPWKMQSNGSTPALVDSSTGLFGSDLEQRIEVEKCVIPGIVTRCIEEVELRGMDAEGIYRKSGGSSQVQMIRDGFEKSADYDISDPDLDIHAVTSALKQYFRKLPTPLITYDVYDKLLDATDIKPVSARIDVMQRGLQDLPRVHRDVLEFLIFHLRRVVEREKENLMTSLNVAVVFAPTILRPESLSREMNDVQKKNEALQFLVDNCQEIFMGIEE